MRRKIQPWLVALAVVVLSAAPTAVLAEEAKPAEESKPAEEAESETGCCCLKQQPGAPVEWKCGAKLLPEGSCEAAAAVYKRDHTWTAGECKKD